jgi:NTE family protein
MGEQGNGTEPVRPTCCNCETGERRVWTAADGIGLSRAVASSCAIPGFFPTVSFGGERFMDGSRGRNYHAAVLEDVQLDAAIYIGPKIQAVDLEGLIRDDMAAIESTGVATHTIMGSPRLDAADLNLMDATQRPLALEIGIGDGADQAAAVADLLG